MTSLLDPASALREAGALETRNWRIWDEQHPYLRHPKPKKFLDRTEEYRARDLHDNEHGEGEWGKRSGGSRYGMVTFDGEGRVLLRHVANLFDGYHWTFSKGHPDKGEHPADTALRETLEETGHQPAIVGHVPGGFGGSATGSQNHFYLGTDTKGMVDPTAMLKNAETDDLTWATPAEALALLSQSTNLPGRYRDLQTFKAATEAYAKLHPELNFPKIVLPPPPPKPKGHVPKGGLFTPTDPIPEPKPSYSKPPSHHSSSYGSKGWTTPKGEETPPASWPKKLPIIGSKINQGQMNFLQALKGKKGNGKRDWHEFDAARPHHDPTAGIPRKDRLGRCYELAGKYHVDNPDTTLVHGSIHGMGAPRIGHAWVVHGDGKTVWEPATGQEWDKPAFDAVFHAEPEHTYTHDQALTHMIEDGHWGPWEEPQHPVGGQARADDLATRDWIKWDLEHSKKGQHMDPVEYDKALKDAWHKGNKHALKHIDDEKLTDRQRDKLAMHHSEAAAKAEQEHRYLDAAKHRGKASAYTNGKMKKGVFFGKHGIFGGAKGMSKEIAKSMLKSQSPIAHAPPLALLGAFTREDTDVLETRNWTKWHEEHPYVAHPRKKGESPEEYDHRLKADYSEWLRKGGKRIAGDLIPGDRLHYGNEDHIVTAVGRHKTPGSTKLAITMKGEQSGIERTVIAGRTANVQHAHEPVSPRESAPTKVPEHTEGVSEARRQRMFESHRDALAKAQEKADAMPHGEVFTGHRKMTDAEYEAHRQHVAYETTRHGAADLDHSPFSTHISEDVVNGMEGAYTPSRQKLHQAIIDDVMKRAEGVPDDHQAIIMGGPGGAGKSTVLRKHASDPNSTAGKLGIKYARYAEHDDPANFIEKGDGIGEPTNFVVLNPDDIKTEIANRGGVPNIDHLSPMEAAGPFVHEEASALTQRIADRLTSQGKNVIWDITLNSDKSGESRVDALRHTPSGYHISAPFVNVKLGTSATNAEQRHRHGQDDLNTGKPGAMGGRYVPSDMILSATDKEGKYESANRAAWQRLKDRGLFDHSMLIDNEGYANRLVEEHGKSLAGSTRAAMTEAPGPGKPTSDITEQIQAYRDGQMGFGDLLNSLANRTYEIPSFMQGDAPATNMLDEDTDYSEPGTWGEVTRANDTGLLSDDEYQAIHQAACEVHGAGERSEGPLEGDLGDGDSAVLDAMIRLDGILEELDQRNWVMFDLERHDELVGRPTTPTAFDRQLKSAFGKHKVATTLVEADSLHPGDRVLSKAHPGDPLTEHINIGTQVHNKKVYAVLTDLDGHEHLKDTSNNSHLWKVVRGGTDIRDTSTESLKVGDKALIGKLGVHKVTAVHRGFRGKTTVTFKHLGSGEEMKVHAAAVPTVQKIG